MPTQLTTETATITTATIQIQTLTIGRKQVTLAVFRQLREEPLIAEDGTLNGAPWGTVNYHPDKCATDHPKHWHIVWQRGDELLRTRVYEKPSFDLSWATDWAPEGTQVFWPDVAGAYVEMWVREWLHGRTNGTPLVQSVRSPGSYSDERTLQYPGLTVGVDVSRLAIEAAEAKDALNTAEERTGRDPSDWYQRALQRAQEKARATLAELDQVVDSWGTSLDELKSDLDAAVAAEMARRERHRDTRAALAKLPQLFIAV
ncbi:hypothetical protein ACFY2G_04310 [Streptomyces collinus]|uniref:hypothetical protein n=1 Tax=Streptomyces collinus TaxID=42684 RepID=UPI0036902812